MHHIALAKCYRYVMHNFICGRKSNFVDIVLIVFSVLFSGALSSQEQLVVAVQNSVGTIVQLAEDVKSGAASLGSNNPEAQVMLINAVKDVATALGDLIHSTNAASGKGMDHPSMNHLKDSAKVRKVFLYSFVSFLCDLNSKL